ncbi:MAG: acetate--CoA ligase family protein [Dehalococcoidia bacterium]
MSIASVIDNARSEGRAVLTEVESKRLLEEAGIATVPTSLAANAEEASRAAVQAGFPVALKIVSRDVTHKSDVGGVKLDLRSTQEVKEAFQEIEAAIRQREPQARIDGVAVQPMARPGVEVIAGMSVDPQFGPVLMFGLGGVLVEVLKDVSFRIVPLELRDARQMIREIKGFPVLTGFRGQEPADLGALEQLLLRLSELVEAHPEIKEVDMNPVFACADGAIAVDARIVVA